ncbi:MAG: peptidylprolyl isomerase [Candidatus Peregrinibacteria bacterium]
MAFTGKILTGKHVITLKTSLGDITLELDADAAPKTVTNFVALAESGYYSGITFHRVIPDFMIQGGDPAGNGTGGESIFGATFDDEIAQNPLKSMDRGVIAMANRGPNTNGSQFFIVQAKEGTPWLVGRHTIFGHVTKGLDIVDKIALTPRDASDKPLEPVTFTVEVQK